jgi:hypothetical protein
MGYYQSTLRLDSVVTITLLLTLNLNAMMFILSFICFIVTIEMDDIGSKDFLEQYIDIEDTFKNLL